MSSRFTRAFKTMTNSVGHKKPRLVQKTFARQQVAPVARKMHSDPASSSSDVQNWLSSIGMQQYWPNFAKAGYDDMLIIPMLDASDLDTMGIPLPGHKKKLLLYAQSIAEETTEFQAEAPTVVSVAQPMSASASAPAHEDVPLFPWESAVGAPAPSHPFSSPLSPMEFYDSDPLSSTTPDFWLNDDSFSAQVLNGRQLSSCVCTPTNIVGEALDIITSYEHGVGYLGLAAADAAEFGLEADGVAMFQGLTVDHAKRLIELGALDPNSRLQTSSPSISEFLALAEELKEFGVTFHGYRLLPPRTEAQIAFEGFHIQNMDKLSSEQLERLRSMHADELYEYPAGSNCLRAWWHC